MKKGILILFVLALSPFVSLFAYDCEIDGIYYNRLSADELEVTYKNLSSSYTGDVIVPETVTYRDKVFKVTKISSFAFQGCKGLKSVSLPEGITDLPNYSFSGCSSLTSITFGRGVKNVADYAFYVCPNLKYVVIPVHIPMLSEYVYQPDCENASKLFRNP